ncbi:hypothetical protein SARC_15841, partial [Sphaeroforma arctica JP610]
SASANRQKLITNMPKEERMDFSNLGVELYEHQKIGVQWLHDMEVECRGGLLADSMGVGGWVCV